MAEKSPFATAQASAVSTKAEGDTATHMLVNRTNGTKGIALADGTVITVAPGAATAKPVTLKKGDIELAKQARYFDFKAANYVHSAEADEENDESGIDVTDTSRTADQNK